MSLMEDVRDLVNGCGALTATAKLDYLDDAAPAASVQRLAGTRYLKRYVYGGGTGQTPFAILLRTADVDSAGRAAAASELIGLADYLESLTAADTEMPSGILSVTCESTPVLTERAGNGTEVWRAQYMVNHSIDAPTNDVS